MRMPIFYRHTLIHLGVVEHLEFEKKKIGLKEAKFTSEHRKFTRVYVKNKICLLSGTFDILYQIKKNRNH